MRDQISSDLAAAAAKLTPPIAASTAATTQGWALADWAVACTILYTLVLTSTTMVKNWGDWIGWWKGRVSDVGRLWRWIRGRP